MRSEPIRILQLAHNHPRIHAGGTELVALALHREALAMGIDSWFLGALEPGLAHPHPGTQMIALSEDGRETALFASAFDRFALAQMDYFGFQRELRGYLIETKPDVVHIHHLLNFGLDALFVIRSALPEARIILTLHDYYLICANNGQLYKHDLGARCPGPELRDCLKCFPERTDNDVALRALDIRHALSLVDTIVSPSVFLRDRFASALPWLGDIAIVENGYLGADIPPQPRSNRADFTVFGYFGNLSVVKGVGDLLDAADMLIDSGDAHFALEVHGAQLFTDGPLSARLARARDRLGSRLRFCGAYRPEEMGERIANVDCLVFPSVWWENAPLVVYEALHHRRQVIAYPHGGGHEILRRYDAGVIAERSDSRALAAAMRQVMGDPGLLDTNPPPVAGRRDLLNAYLGLYRQ